jgi:hypothetical protein
LIIRVSKESGQNGNSYFKPQLFFLQLCFLVARATSANDDDGVQI